MFDMRHIASTRLLLRKPSLSDDRALFSSYTQDGDVTKYLVWKPHTSVEETRLFLQQCIDQWNSHQEYNTIVELLETQEVIGMARVKIEKQVATIGYVFAKKQWGHGYATELVKLLIDHLFKTNIAAEVQATCDIANKASVRVLEKAGMHLVKMIPQFAIHPVISSEKRDCLLFSVSKEFA